MDGSGMVSLSVRKGVEVVLVFVLVNRRGGRMV